MPGTLPAPQKTQADLSPWAYVWHIVGAMIGNLIKTNDKRETEALISHAYQIARTLSIDTLLVQIGRLKSMEKINKHRESERVGWIVMEDLKAPKDKKNDMFIPVPRSPLTRVSQMRVGLFLALAQGFIDAKCSVVALSGAYGSDRLDTMMILNPSRDFPWYTRHAKALSQTDLPVRTIERVISCALRLATEGREGRPVGTIFAIGEPEELAPSTRQLILNPVAGHPKKLRSLHNPEFFETLRELTALDGAFIISASGTVESAGTFLGAPTESSMRLAQGLGARHMAAATLTSRCKKALAVVLSQSSGTVTVFQGGSTILKLEKVAPTPTEKTTKKK